jgi:hypothetical protein
MYVYASGLSHMSVPVLSVGSGTGVVEKPTGEERSGSMAAAGDVDCELRLMPAAMADSRRADAE